MSRENVALEGRKMEGKKVETETDALAAVQERDEGSRN